MYGIPGIPRKGGENSIKKFKNFFRFYVAEASLWYTGGFDQNYEDILEECEVL